MLPVHFLRVDGGGVLLLWQIVLKGYANLCQLLLAFGLLTALEQGAQVAHALLHIACHHLVQSETGRLVELTKEILHEVLQESLLAVELQKCCLVDGGGFGGLEVALVVDTRYYGEFPRFFLVLYLCAVFQDQHIVVIAV